mgnify:CR=1 FL=1
MNKCLIFVILALLVAAFVSHYKASVEEVKKLQKQISVFEEEKETYIKTIGKLEDRENIQKKAIETLIIQNDRAIKAYKIVLEHSKRIEEKNKSCSTKFS